MLGKKMNRGSALMLGMKMNRSNSADKDFAKEMIKHHQAAIKMSEWLLDNGSHPKMKVLARGIIEAQTREISVLQGFISQESRR